MLLLIGLQSGKGLHPDQTVNCQNCQDCQKSPKLGSTNQLVFHQTAWSEGSQFSLLAVLAIMAILLILVSVCVLNSRRSRAQHPCDARSCTCHKFSLPML